MLRLVWLGCGMLCCTLPAAAQQPDFWPMKGHDARRTGQSGNLGPVMLQAEQGWTYQAPAALELNIGATLTPGGVFFGSWGLLRTDNTSDRRNWDKSDGKVYGLNPVTGTPLWGGPLDLDRVHACYERAGREKTPTDETFCGSDNPYLATYYNGTVEGQAAFDAARNTLYFGRGDGRLFAIDPDAGEIRWRYQTFNPEIPDDPDGGGELIASPLLGPDGTVYIATWGEGPYETNAFYAVNPEGTLRWRYPAATSLPQRLFASPALSPDGTTVYGSTFFDDAGAPGMLYAFHTTPGGPATDAERLKWALPLTFENRPVWTATLAVGADGTVYVGGAVVNGFRSQAVLFAVQDTDTGPVLKWAVPYVVLDDGADYVLGLALREQGGTTQRVFATTANVASLFVNGRTEGALHALDPQTGTREATYDPSDDIPEAIGGLTSPALSADGLVYFGVRGQAGENGLRGQYFGVAYLPGQFQRLWNVAVDGHVEWNHPALGPDGWLYAGSSVGPGTGLPFAFPPDAVPGGTTPTFYGFKGSVTPVANEDSRVQPTLSLGVPYPNPARTRTQVSFSLDRPQQVRLALYDVLGRHVQTVRDQWNGAGRYEVALDVGHLAPGTYVLQLSGANGAHVQPLVVAAH